MITGRSSGSGKYSYHGRSSGNQTVHVSHMPEDNFGVRIIISHNGENAIPILKINIREAEMLWAALSGMAKDLNWKDMEEN